MTQEVPEQEVDGVDTIVSLATNPPQKIELAFDLVYTEELLRSDWNASYIAILPFCFKCKTPLVWHRNTKSGVLFHCPLCKRQWVQNNSWKEDKQKKCR